MTVKLDFHIDQGTDCRCPLCFLDDYSELDLTGCTARMEVRPSASSERVVDLLATENGRITIRGSSLIVYWPHAVTEALPEGTWVYDLELVTSGGEVARVLCGRLIVSKEVTRWPYPETA